MFVIANTRFHIHPLKYCSIQYNCFAFLWCSYGCVLLSSSIKYNKSNHAYMVFYTMARKTKIYLFQLISTFKDVIILCLLYQMFAVLKRWMKVFFKILLTSITTPKLMRQRHPFERCRMYDGLASLLQKQNMNMILFWGTLLSKLLTSQRSYVVQPTYSSRWHFWTIVPQILVAKRPLIIYYSYPLLCGFWHASHAANSCKRIWGSLMAKEVLFFFSFFVQKNALLLGSQH